MCVCLLSFRIRVQIHRLFFRITCMEKTVSSRKNICWKRKRVHVKNGDMDITIFYMYSFSFLTNIFRTRNRFHQTRSVVQWYLDGIWARKSMRVAAQSSRMKNLSKLFIIYCVYGRNVRPKLAVFCSQIARLVSRRCYLW